MKKNKPYYAENNQENEDVYTLHPGNAIIYDNIKPEGDMSYADNVVNSDTGSTKMEFRRLAQSDSMMLSRIIEPPANQPSPLTEPMHPAK